MQWEFHDTYFPRHHAEQARQLDDELRADGGSEMHTGRKDSVIYYWTDPEVDAALTHTELKRGGDTYAVPFFTSVEEAEQYLEQLDGEDGKDLQHLSLYRASVRKEEDATDVLTDQVGLDEMFKK